VVSTAFFEISCKKTRREHGYNLKKKSDSLLSGAAWNLYTSYWLWNNRREPTMIDVETNAD
jgi:hypothetical protein